MRHAHSPFSSRTAGFVLACLAIGQGDSPAVAQSLPTAAENLTPSDLDSEHLFGFTEGSDLGVPGEVELEWETNGRLGKRLGRFLAVDSGLALKMPLTGDFRLAPGVTFNAYDIGARTTGGVNGGFLETRLRLLDRRAAPFGLTLSIVPAYGTVDGSSGAPARSFGTDVALLADRELIPGKLVAAVNLGFAFSTTRPTARTSARSDRASRPPPPWPIRSGRASSSGPRRAMPGPMTAWPSTGSPGRRSISGPRSTRPCRRRPGPRSPGTSRSPGGRPASRDRSTCRDSTVTRCGCASATISEPRPGRAVTFRLPSGEAAPSVVA